MRPVFAPSGRARVMLTRTRLPAGRGGISSSASVAAGAGVLRAAAVAASSRLMLTPTGTGSCDHIGAKVQMPPPIPLKDGIYEVGRSSPADILLPIPTVSSRHALLRVEDNTVYVTDLNSTNGTMVNGQELSPMDNVAVEVGAEVIFGDMYLARFQLDLVPDAAAVPAPGSASGGSASGAATNSGTLAIGAEDSGEGPARGGGGGGGFWGLGQQQQQQQQPGLGNGAAADQARTVRSPERRPQKRVITKKDWGPYERF